MGKDLFDHSAPARELFQKADRILDFEITRVMFQGSDEELRQTKVTQPAIFLHSVILAASMGASFEPEMVAGHSLGEFSALVANRTLSFEDGLRLVSRRASAMQKACEAEPSAMAAILGLDDHIVEETCKEIDEIVVPANYNSPGQIVISGSITGIDTAVKLLIQKGARRALKLPVGGAFHSPLMEPARKELAEAILATPFSKPVCPVYQNVDANPYSEPELIRINLVAQLTSPVRWTQTIKNMIDHGATTFTEVGPGKVLQGLIRKINQDIMTQSL
jgi:[acyl-carrier-protein] S-malonyltransferase